MIDTMESLRYGPRDVVEDPQHPAPAPEEG